MLQNLDTFNFTEIMNVSWDHACNIPGRAVNRGMERKIGRPSWERTRGWRTGWKA